MTPSPFATESALHGAVTAFLTRLEIPHRNQYPVGGGFADVALELPDGTPWGLLELKNGLDADDLSLADAADYFEQAAKYRMASGLPVFLGPFFQQGMGLSEHFHGGAEPKSIAALSALGGRLDVGLFFLHSITGYEGRHAGWYGFQMTLRQHRCASHHTAGYSMTTWPTERLPLVDFLSAGSRKDRG